MKLEIQERQYVIRFHHDVVDKFTEASLHEVVPNVDGEGNIVDVFVEETPIYTAAAWCSYKDNYSKATGRKIALARLLEWMSRNRFNLSEDERREIWAKYFETHRK